MVGRLSEMPSSRRDGVTLKSPALHAVLLITPRWPEPEAWSWLLWPHKQRGRQLLRSRTHVDYTWGSCSWGPAANGSGPMAIMPMLA